MSELEFACAPRSLIRFTSTTSSLFAVVRQRALAPLLPLSSRNVAKGRKNAEVAAVAVVVTSVADSIAGVERDVVSTAEV